VDSEREQLVLREDDLHLLNEGITQSEKDRDARDDSDEGPNQRGKGIAMDSSSSSDDEDGGNDGEEVSGDEFDDSNNGGNTGTEGGIYSVGGSQQSGVDMSWESNYYATHDTDMKVD